MRGAHRVTGVLLHSPDRTSPASSRSTGRDLDAAVECSLSAGIWGVREASARRAGGGVGDGRGPRGMFRRVAHPGSGWSIATVRFDGVAPHVRVAIVDPVVRSSAGFRGEPSSDARTSARASSGVRRRSPGRAPGRGVRAEAGHAVLRLRDPHTHLLGDRLVRPVASCALPDAGQLPRRYGRRRLYPDCRTPLARDRS